MKRFLTVLMMILVGCFCLSAETIKGQYYDDDGAVYEYTLSHYSTEDALGVFSLSEAQDFFDSLGWDDNYSVLQNEALYFNKILETLSDEVEDNNLIELKITKDDKTTLMYIFTIDWNSIFNKQGYIKTLVFVKEL